MRFSTLWVSLLLVLLLERQSYLVCGQELTMYPRLASNLQSSASACQGLGIQAGVPTPNQDPYLSEICTEFSDEIELSRKSMQMAELYFH